MIRRRIDSLVVLILIFICCKWIISCDSTNFVYVDDPTFQKQLSYLKNAYVEIAYRLDPTKKEGYKARRKIKEDKGTSICK